MLLALKGCMRAKAGVIMPRAHRDAIWMWYALYKKGTLLLLYHGKIYTFIVFGDAAPSVLSFIGSNVIFWWKSCVRSAGHISWWIYFKIFTDVHHSQIYTPIVFGDAALNVPSYRVKGHILVEMCVLCRPHFLTDFFHILYRCAP